jgi:hypothetical protein
LTCKLIIEPLCVDAVLSQHPGIRLGNAFSTISTATTTPGPAVPRKAAEFSGGAGAAAAPEVLLSGNCGGVVTDHYDDPVSWLDGPLDFEGKPSVILFVAN